MAVDARLLLMGQQPDFAAIDNAVARNKLLELTYRTEQKAAPIKQAQAEAKLEATRLENQKAQEELLAASLYRDADAAYTALEGGNPQAALDIVQTRQQTLKDQFGLDDPVLGQVAEQLRMANTGTPQMREQVIADLMPKVGNLRDTLAARYGARDSGKRETAVVGSNLVDKQTGEVIFRADPSRKTEKDANGRLRYTDTGEFVFPGVERDAGYVSEREKQDFREKQEERIASQLPGPLLTSAVQASEEAATASQSSRQMMQIAQQYEQMEPSSGRLAEWQEQYKQFTGSEDAVTNLRKEYLRVRNSDVVANLPPGVASDRDIEIFMAGFPSENANPQMLAAFMRGMAKARKYEADYLNFRSKYIYDNKSVRGLNEAWEDVASTMSYDQPAGGAVSEDRMRQLERDYGIDS